MKSLLCCTACDHVKLLLTSLLFVVSALSAPAVDCCDSSCRVCANVGATQLHPISEASVDKKRPDTAAADASSLPLRISNPRGAMCAAAGRLRRRHHDLRCRALDSFRRCGGHGKLSAVSFTYPAQWHRHGLLFNGSRPMRFMLRALRVLPGNSATGTVLFFPVLSLSLSRHLPPVRRCADRQHSGPP